MFEEPVEAWANGPVVADVWRAEKRNHRLPSHRDLDETMRETVALVMSRYSRLTGTDLIDVTHTEPPWREVSGRDDLDQTISQESLKAFFTTLDGHEAFSFRPFRMTVERKKIVEDAKARAQR
jgi:uncharacterized phage-associated protein